ncbi:MAG TPA: VOC family protein [Pseudonocardiaceae bacterium]|nr:VOC family protein [Pseudonocardiaceae bacterium]
MPKPTLTVTTVNIGAPDAAELANFYVRLLGWEIMVAEPDWVMLRGEGAGVRLSCQTEPGYQRPAWPTRPDAQQMMLHLEIMVDDLAASVEHAIACGATLAEYQPQDDVRVCLDPAGHPFCLWINA